MPGDRLLFSVFRGVVQCQASVYCIARGTEARSPCNMAALARTEPVFLIRKDLPGVEVKSITVFEICQAEERTSGFESFDGAQRIRGYLRLYPNGGCENELADQ